MGFSPSAPTADYVKSGIPAASTFAFGGARRTALDLHHYIHYYVYRSFIVLLETKTFSWPDDKNRENIKKHGISFPEAAPVFLDPYLVIRHDDAHSTMKETRWKGIGVLGNNLLLAIIFTENKENVVRLISVRETSKKEKEDYSENIRYIFGA